MSSPKTPLPSGKPPLGGSSLWLVNTEESPSTGISRPSDRSREQLHEHERFEAMTLKKKNARLEAELMQANDKLMQANDRLDRLEAASELADERLRSSLEHGDRPSTATENQKIAMLEADLAQVQEEIQNQKVGFELQLHEMELQLQEMHAHLQEKDDILQEKDAQLQEKDEILKSDNIRIKDLLQALKEGSSGVASPSDHDTGLQDFTNAVLKKFHNVIAVGEILTEHHEPRIRMLGSAADQFNTVVEQANDRAKSLVEEARSAYDSGLISHEYMIETEELYKSEAEIIASVRDIVVNYVLEESSTVDKLRKADVDARKTFGRYLTDGIISAYTKPFSALESSDMQKGNVVAARGDAPTEESEPRSMFQRGETAEEGATATGLHPESVPMSRSAATVRDVETERTPAGKAPAAAAPARGAPGGGVLIAEAPAGGISWRETTSGGSGQAVPAAPARGGTTLTGSRYNEKPGVIRHRQPVSQAQEKRLVVDDQGFTLAAKSKSAPTNRGEAQKSIAEQAASENRFALLNEHPPPPSTSVLGSTKYTNTQQAPLNPRSISRNADEKSSSAVSAAIPAVTPPAPQYQVSARRSPPHTPAQPSKELSSFFNPSIRSFAEIRAAGPQTKITMFEKELLRIEARDLEKRSADAAAGKVVEPGKEPKPMMLEEISKMLSGKPWGEWADSDESSEHEHGEDKGTDALSSENRDVHPPSVSQVLPAPDIGVGSSTRKQGVQAAPKASNNASSSTAAGDGSEKSLNFPNASVKGDTHNSPRQVVDAEASQRNSTAIANPAVGGTMVAIPAAPKWVIPGNAILGKRGFEDEQMYRPQSSHRKKPKNGKNAKFFTAKP